MSTGTYLQRRTELEVYFDRTAADAWARLTSTAPVGRIRATVRAGRDAMRRTLLGYLPSDLRGARVLDAGCGTGALSVEIAARGAKVLAVDLAPTLIGLARDRSAHDGSRAAAARRIEFRVGDMSDPGLGEFDRIVAMDSLIHYGPADLIDVLARLAARARHQVLFTVAPKTPLLMAMWMVGRLFPRRDRAPALEPIAERSLRDALAADPRFANWRIRRSACIDCGFYKSHAVELVRQ